MKNSIHPSRTPKFARSQIIRLDRLLHMRYTPTEIATEIEVSVDTIYRSYVPAGCPVERHTSGHFWIIGSEFREWVLTIRAAETPTKKRWECSEPGVGWCFRCSRCVKIMNAKIKRVNHYLELMKGECEYCGCKVNRGNSVERRVDHDR